ncbi:MAG: ABC transporter permease [Legionellaceae bacterium]|nr:ABC transporter permease [Legionellaceae bacterium]
MNLRAQIEQALVNILAAKLRSFLALLGILVGTAAVVTLISSGQMATEKALLQFRALGTDLLAVSLFNKRSQSATREGDVSMTLERWRQLPRYLPDIQKIAPYATTYQSLSFAGKELQGPIIGADESLADVIHIRMAAGHFVSFVDTYEHYAVIGAALASQIREQTLDSPVGKLLHIGNSVYRIIGVAENWPENAFFNEDINQAVIVPIQGIALINQSAQINHAVILLQSATTIDPFMEKLRQLLQQQVPDRNIFMRSAKQIIAGMESQGQIFTLLLGVIGGISLLVGGIGVMNVMLVAVTERKKEIGIRKAVGARNRDIQTLFLTESTIIALLGGLLGVSCGLLLSFVVAHLSHWPFFISPIPPLIGFVISVATGIFFGFYPARRAALLAPIVSLRGEG